MSVKETSIREYRHRLLVLYPSVAMAVIGLVYLIGFHQMRAATVQPDVGALHANSAETVLGTVRTLLMPLPDESVVDMIRRNSLYNSAIALVTIGLISLIGVGMNRRVYEPLGLAVQAAGKIAKGQLNVTMPEEGPAEIHKIGEAINHMIAEVRYHRHTLSNMVKTRTESIEAARQALEENMHQLRASYDSAQEAVLIVDIHDGTILQANRQLTELFGCGDVDLTALKGDDFCKAMKEMFADAIEFTKRWAHYTRNPILEGNEEWVLAKPRNMSLSVYTAPVRSGDDRTISGRLWTFKDATQQREFDDKLRRAQKMDAMTHFAGTVAHDFNNLLTVIMGNLSIARLEAAEGDPNQRYLTAAEDATQQATELVKQLLGFSDRARLNLEVVDVNQVIGNVSEVIRQTADVRITVTCELSDDLWDVPADRDQLEQVLINLGMNALDAMDSGGKLTLSSQNITLDPGECDMPATCCGGEYVRLTVADTGEGMPGHVQEQMFEPFFSTRRGSESQGLGLAMAYSAVTKHGGWISCDSRPGEGTELQVFLKRTGQKRIPEMNNNIPEANMGQNPLVLVVDDEAGVRRIATSVLKRGGFVTAEACDGYEAIQVYQERRNEISAVLLDLSMPVLSGRETFSALKDMDMNLPILICSGYPVEPAEFAQETGYHPDGIVQKPFNVMDICDKVTEMIHLAPASVA